MYSVVMMVMMTSAPDAVAFGGRNRGCCGDQVSYSCGCEGGGRRSRRGNGCCGDDGCGCQGGRRFGNRRGGNGCCGNDNCCGHDNNCGCQGGHVSYNSGCGCQGGMMVAPAMPAAPAPAPAPKAGGEMPKALAPTPALIVVTLPADAKVTIDGAATSSTSEIRRFQTPSMNLGSEATYTLTAEIVREGKTLKTTRVVTVRGGETTELTLGGDAFAVSFARN